MCCRQDQSRILFLRRLQFVGPGDHPLSCLSQSVGAGRNCQRLEVLQRRPGRRVEFLQQKGAVDFICDRRELRDKVASILAMLQRQPADAVS